MLLGPCIMLAAAAMSASDEASYTPETAGRIHLPSDPSELPVSDDWATDSTGELPLVPLEEETPEPDGFTAYYDDPGLILGEESSLPDGPGAQSSIANLALGWGVGEIGPGVLAPHAYQVSSATNNGGGGQGGASGVPGTSEPISFDDYVDDDLGGTSDPEPVPEPASIALWCLVAGWGYRRLRRGAETAR